jgi:hypothetical protein
MLLQSTLDNMLSLGGAIAAPMISMTAVDSSNVHVRVDACRDPDTCSSVLY